MRYHNEFCQYFKIKLYFKLGDRRAIRARKNSRTARQEQVSSAAGVNYVTVRGYHPVRRPPDPCTPIKVQNTLHRFCLIEGPIPPVCVQNASPAGTDAGALRSGERPRARQHELHTVGDLQCRARP